jgi:iron complex transport system substrate-binding protein
MRCLSDLRIASLLPSATEILFSLGLGDQVVAVSHECDYPPEAAKRPVLTKSAIHNRIHKSIDVDREVDKRGGDIYEIDEKLLEKLQPDLILTQELCAVCAVSYTKVREAARVLDTDTKIISLEPTNLEDIVDNIMLVGKTTGKPEQAQELASLLQSRIDTVKNKTRDARSRPRVFFMEWLQPLWAGGHWIPQMVDYAGGIEGLGRLGKPSHRIEWSEVLDYQPEIIVLSPCGFGVDGVRKELHVLESYHEWDKIPAFKNSSIYAVNASAYFSRPGPRIVKGLELLAYIIHPELFAEKPNADDMMRIDLDFLRA